jgi:hypothetical protein
MCPNPVTNAADRDHAVKKERNLFTNPWTIALAASYGDIIENIGILPFVLSPSKPAVSEAEPHGHEF